MLSQISLRHNRSTQAVDEERLAQPRDSVGVVAEGREVERRRAAEAVCEFKDKTNAALQALIVGEVPLKAEIKRLNDLIDGRRR